MKQPKEKTRYWNKKILELFNRVPKSQLTEYRHRAVRAVLVNYYPQLAVIEKEKLITILSDADYVARKMRYLTEGHQKEIKKTLSEQKVVELHFQ